MRLIFLKPSQVCHFGGHNPTESLKISHTRDIGFMYHIHYIYVMTDVKLSYTLHVMLIILFNSLIVNELHST